MQNHKAASWLEKKGMDMELAVAYFSNEYNN